MQKFHNCCSPSNRLAANSNVDINMTKISILYPNTPGERFDLDYHVKTHMPLSIKLPSAP